MVEFLEVTDVDEQKYYVNVHQIQAVRASTMNETVSATITLSRVTIDVYGKEAEKVLEYVKSDCLNFETEEECVKDECLSLKQAE